MEKGAPSHIQPLGLGTVLRYYCKCNGKIIEGFKTGMTVLLS